MNSETYNTLYKKLSKLDDIPVFSDEFDISQETLLAILQQKLVREVISRYHRVEAQAAKLWAKWQHGETFVSIARAANFPPVLTASIILRKAGIARDKIRYWIKDPRAADRRRIKVELSSAVDEDWLYSPRANREQNERGKMVEARVEAWLLGLHVEAKRECELDTEITPDFLLLDRLDIDDVRVHWIECKASFGDAKELRRNTRQVSAYVAHFGSGLLVYWYGFVESLSMDWVVLRDRHYFCKRM